MTIHVCPTEIFVLCKSEDTISEGRRRTVEWAKMTCDQAAEGDKIIIPDPETGDPIEYEKIARTLQS